MPMDELLFRLRIFALFIVFIISYLIMSGARKMKGKSLSQTFLYIGIALLVLFASYIVNILQLFPRYSWEVWPYLEVVSELLAVVIIYYAFRRLKRNTEAYEHLAKKEVIEKGME